MRMRKKKNGEARLLLCREVIFDAPAAPLDDPSAVMGKPGAPVLLEIGAGKGGFACEMARRNQDAAYFAMEKVSDCVIIAAEKAMKQNDGKNGNLRFIIDNADNLLKIFAKGTVDKIFLNFSDPWSKKGYAKRRLTHRRYLSLYMWLLRDGGTLTFKTDNTGLFDFTLEEISDMGLSLEAVTRDLHSSEWAGENVMTEYETAFSAEGIKINMLTIKKPRGFNAPLPEEFKSGKQFFLKSRGEENE